MNTAKACGKIILLGEHSVVYGKPGLAVPIKDLYTEVECKSAEAFSYFFDHDPSENQKEKMNMLFEVIFSELKVGKNVSLSIKTELPIGCGMGSSASLSIAIIRALCQHYGIEKDIFDINKIAFECEKIFHGNPSGIDNSVIAFESPIYYKDGKSTPIKMNRPLYLVIANTGKKVDTRDVVSEVRALTIKEPEKTNTLFDEMAAIAEAGKQYLESGDMIKLGKMLSLNHDYLKLLGVSSLELDALVDIALSSGAYGAKLAGAGKGGNVIAIVSENNKEKVLEAMSKRAKQAWLVTIK